MWHLVCTYCGQVVLIFPGVVNASRLVPGRGEMGFSWKGLGNEPLLIFGLWRFPAKSIFVHCSFSARPTLLHAEPKLLTLWITKDCVWSSAKKRHRRH